jgi:carbonic anhydrase
MKSIIFKFAIFAVLLVILINLTYETKTQTRTKMKMQTKTKTHTGARMQMRSKMQTRSKMQSKTKMHAKMMSKSKSGKAESLFGYYADLHEDVPTIDAPKSASATSASSTSADTTAAPTATATDASSSGTKSSSGANDSSTDSNGTNTNGNSSESGDSSSSGTNNAPPEGWVAISSTSFRNKRKFPPIVLPDGKEVMIKVDTEYFRLNDLFIEDKKTDPSSPPWERFFYFRLSGAHIYYSMTKNDVNIVGTVALDNLNKISKDEDSTRFCFWIDEAERSEWKLCTQTYEERLKWMCAINKLIQVVDGECTQGYKAVSKLATVIEEKRVTPIILIPLPSKPCNDGWDYTQKGSDWECICKEGKEQSPIDLPTSSTAIPSPVSPLFQYTTVPFKKEETSVDGHVKSEEFLKIKYFKNALRIFHPNFGKIVTLDGAVYVAEEIIFHTPAEHTINGKRYDMEMQVVHYGQTQGDIHKQVILSILFEKKAGIYNKFIDDVDFFQLPNPYFKEREITKDLFIPKVFYSATDENIPVMRPFSFFTYQGSLPFPPCSERTIHYVASEPIPIASVPLQMFREALSAPDMKDISNDNVFLNTKQRDIQENYRAAQPLNDRSVFWYDHEKYCGLNHPKTKAKRKGHYEKIRTPSNEYFYVPGKDPSGLPGAYVVSKAHAEGTETE